MLGTAGSLTGVSFKMANASSVTRTVKIYMANTDKESFTHTQDWVNLSEANLVYSGPFTYPGAEGEWASVNFQTNFEYEGGNAILCVYDCSAYFENYSDEKEIASNNLLSLYFIKLPAIDNVESDDIFGIRELSFKKRNFSSSEISELIESKYLFEIDQKCSKSKKKSFSLSDSSVHDAIYNYCTSSNSDETKRNFYRIPIQFIYGEDEHIALTRAKIIDQVANHYKKEGEETKKDVWKNSITSFFTNCLSQIELNEIEVKNEIASLREGNVIKLRNYERLPCVKGAVSHMAD